MDRRMKTNVRGLFYCEREGGTGMNSEGEIKLIGKQDEGNRAELQKGLME
jgi:hypothetical protein